MTDGSAEMILGDCSRVMVVLRWWASGFLAVRSDKKARMLTRQSASTRTIKKT